MKIKIIQAISERKLEQKVNEFIACSGIKVLELQYQLSVGTFSVMIVYDEVNWTSTD